VVEKKPLFQLLPATEAAPLSLLDWRQSYGGILLEEMAALLRVARVIKPSLIFEIGTFLGETTLQLATLPFMKPKPSSIGRPMPGWDLVLLNEEDQPCPPGEEGEICIRLKDGATTKGMPGLFCGYLDEPERTAKVVYGGFYHTGDKAWVDEDGYFWFLGRTDDLIKSSGYRIGPFEVESALVSHAAVVEAAVTGVPDPVRGMAVKATVVIGPGYTPGDELTKELQNHVKSVTAPYKYPRIIEYVSELPKTISGKIKRAEIRARDQERMDV